MFKQEYANRDEAQADVAAFDAKIGYSGTYKVQELGSRFEIVDLTECMTNEEYDDWLGGLPERVGPRGWTHVTA